MILITGRKHDIIKKNTKALVDASKEVHLEVNTQKNRYYVHAPSSD
jgi:hypothetical protein